MLKRLLIFAALAAAFAVAPLHAADNEEAVRAAFEHLLDGEYGQSYEIAQPLAAEGDADAQHLLGYLFEKGFGVTKDMARALDLYARSALQGQADSQFALGELAFTGDGVRQDYERAAGWYELAVSRGHPTAKARLGVMYAEGLGVKPDRRRALLLFEEAAAAGEPEAQYQLGSIYLVGGGLDRPQDYNKAAALFEKSALQGYAPAQFNLALIHDGGMLGKRDDELTVRWMRAAADAGMPNAMVAMGLLTHDARASGDSAADWFERAAKAGDAQGQFLYAVALKEGDGRKKNVKDAKQWVERALAQPGALDPDMRKGAEALNAELTRAIARR